MSFTFVLLSGMCLIARPWLNWFEGSWGPEYYAEQHAGFLGNFDHMLTAIFIAGIVFAIIALVLWIVGSKVEPSRAEVRESLRVSRETIAARHNREVM